MLLRHEHAHLDILRSSQRLFWFDLSGVSAHNHYPSRSCSGLVSRDSFSPLWTRKSPSVWTRKLPSVFRVAQIWVQLDCVCFDIRKERSYFFKLCWNIRWSQSATVSTLSERVEIFERSSTRSICFWQKNAYQTFRERSWMSTYFHTFLYRGLLLPVRSDPFSIFSFNFYLLNCIIFLGLLTRNFFFDAGPTKL